jgi:NADH-quinone oxidoreductase subunit L
MFILEHLWIIPLLPLAGAALNGLLGRAHATRLVNIVAVGTTGLAFLSVLELLREFRHLAPAHIPHVRSYLPWIEAGGFRADFAFQVDQLTLVMLLVVTGVGWLIHIYATGYMAHEHGYGRFFAYLNLFMFFMVILVMAANFLLMFVGWEGVGLCSYLLIGFYFLKKSASDAGKKAFIVNRIGDFGFLLAIFLIYETFGTLDYTAVFGFVHERPIESGAAGLLTGIALLMFVGATGKSAQLPLYVWLPDAMEGPTPVSALIHAATMVTAGVYMVARCSVIFSHAPIALLVVAWVGCATAIFAATIGLVQTDIKRILAYSTVSQLGYMFLACGVGAYAIAVFHLMTHAFFKALLFLASGSVIHAMGGEQNIWKMGGLRKHIPVTYGTMLTGALAISGLPLLAGFFSKDAILFETIVSPYGHRVLYGFGLLTALFTAFYMFRLIFVTFWGAPRYDAHHVHVHESPRTMLAPLVALAVLSVVGGWMAAPVLLHGKNYFAEYLAPVFRAAGEIREQVDVAHAVGGDHYTLELLLSGFATLAFVLGTARAWQVYVRSPEKAERLHATWSGIHRLLTNKYYVDELYDRAVVQPVKWLSTSILWQRIDVSTIDGFVNHLADAARSFGGGVRQMQSGNTRSYGAWVVLGVLSVITLLVWLIP